MREIADFSRKERRRAYNRLRYVLDAPDKSSKVLFKSIYWNVPFLIRLMDYIGGLLYDDPSTALMLSELLPGVSDRISFGGNVGYRGTQEKTDFRSLARAIRGSGLHANGKYEQAAAAFNEALVLSNQASSAARAETLRRAANLAVDEGRYSEGLEMAHEALEVFHELGVSENAAFTHILMGNALNLSVRAGAGSLEYSKAIYFATKYDSERSRRALCIATANLGRDAVVARYYLPYDAHQWVGAAKEAMKGRPSSVAKVHVRWLEALAAYPTGIGRYTMKHLEGARDQLLQLGSFHAAVACTADLIAVALDYGSKDFDGIVARSYRQLRESTTDESLSRWLDRWVDRPSDVEVLRKLHSAAQSRVSRAE